MIKKEKSMKKVYLNYLTKILNYIKNLFRNTLISIQMPSDIVKVESNFLITKMI